jgi:hypothetical protein
VNSLQFPPPTTEAVGFQVGAFYVDNGIARGSPPYCELKTGDTIPRSHSVCSMLRVATPLIHQPAPGAGRRQRSSKACPTQTPFEVARASILQVASYSTACSSRPNPAIRIPKYKTSETPTPAVIMQYPSMAQYQPILAKKFFPSLKEGILSPSQSPDPRLSSSWQG